MEATALHLACRALSLATVKVLIAAGADVRATDAEGANVLDYAFSAHLRDDSQKGTLRDSKLTPS